MVNPYVTNWGDALKAAAKADPPAEEETGLLPANTPMTVPEVVDPDDPWPRQRSTRKQRIEALPADIKNLTESNFPLESATNLAAEDPDITYTNLSRTGLIEDKQLRKLLSLYCIENGINPKTALLALTLLFYKGMSADNFNDKESVEIENKKFTVKNFNTVKGRAGLKSAKNRQIARTLAPQMLKIAVARKMDGQLCTAIEKFETVSEVDRPKLCDFYGADLVGYPVKKMIENHLDRARKSRRASNDAMKRRKGKGGRNRGR
jgi:hypothetical protein